MELAFYQVEERLLVGFHLFVLATLVIQFCTQAYTSYFDGCYCNDWNWLVICLNGMIVAFLS